MHDLSQLTCSQEKKVDAMISSTRLNDKNSKKSKESDLFM